MKPEELLQMLREAGMDDGAIEQMLEEIIAQLKPAGEANPEGNVPPAESEEEKADRIFGAI